MFTVKATRAINLETIVFPCEHFAFTWSKGDNDSSQFVAYGVPKGIGVDVTDKNGNVVWMYLADGPDERNKDPDAFDTIIVENAAGKTTHLMRCRH